MLLVVLDEAALEMRLLSQGAHYSCSTTASINNMRFKSILNRLVAATSLFAVGCLATHQAQAAPSYVPRQITLVVPFAAGGPTDKIARAFIDTAQRIDPGLTFTIANVGGSGGTLGAAQVASGPADGSVLLLHNIAFAVAPSLYQGLPYDTLKSFSYLGLLEEVPMTLIARSTLPSTFTGLQQWLRDNQSAATIAHAGAGSASHLCGLLFQRAINQTISERVYTGNAPAVVDVSAGRVDMVCDAANASATYLPTNTQVRAYGVTAPDRVNIPALSNIPTFSELGLNEMEITVWFGLSAPKRTPARVQEYLNDLVRSVASDPQFIQAQESTGAVVVKDKRLKPRKHKRFVAGEIDYWADVLIAP